MTTAFLSAATAPHDDAVTVTTALCQVYVFCRDATGSGIAHEYCTDNPALALSR